MNGSEDGADRARADLAAATFRAWQTFEELIRGSASLVEIRQRLTQAPAPGEPGRIFYENLDWFLANKIVPPEATLHEEALYAKLLELPGVKLHFGRNDHARLVRELSAGSDSGAPR